MKKEDEEIAACKGMQSYAFFDPNIKFLDAYDKENSTERADYSQPQNFNETPEVILIV